MLGMHALLRVSIALSFLGTLAAQPEVPGDQCLGGTLVSIQQDSITTKFNQKIITMQVAPDAEIWRRGVDLESIHQLVVGDEIYLKCTRAAGAVVASIVAAVEKDDAIDLTPHHIAEIRVCGGRLLAFTNTTLSVRNDDGVCIIHLKSGAEIWRGEVFHSTGALKLGDDVIARVEVQYPSGELIAEEVLANFTNTEGTIVSVGPDRIVVNQYPGADKHSAYPRGHMTVLFDRRTKFDLDRGELKKGATVRAVGLDLGHNSFRAETIVVEN
jgi:hypothetical protein